MSKEFVLSDRYSALGIPRPRPDTVCKGQCEGTGWVPVRWTCRDKVLSKLWRKAERKKPASDGWHFVKCPKCQGTGKRLAKKAAGS